MTDSEQVLLECDRLHIGFRGGRDEQHAAINLCRRYHGTVLFRGGDVMVIEVGAESGVITDLLARLPRKGVTHLCRSPLFPPAVPVVRPAAAFPEFLRQPVGAQEAHNVGVCAAAGAQPRQRSALATPPTP